MQTKSWLGVQKIRALNPAGDPLLRNTVRSQDELVSVYGSSLHLGWPLVWSLVAPAGCGSRIAQGLFLCGRYRGLNQTGDWHRPDPKRKSLVVELILWGHPAQ